MPGNPHKIPLEPAIQQFVDATSSPPYLFQMPPEEGRTAVNSVQDTDIWKPEIFEEWITIKGGPDGEIKVRLIRRPGTEGQKLPVVFYTHGAGWVFGNAHTHDRLFRDLAIGANAAGIFPEYKPSPEAQFPAAIETTYAALKWVATSEEAASKGLDASRIVVAGDSVGGNMTIAQMLLAKERGNVKITQAILLYPVCDANFDTESYKRFAEGYFLYRDGMKWFWDQYTTSDADRANKLASPLRASLEELKDLPPTLVITAENDVLRDEGEAFATKLRQAGNAIAHARIGGAIHDFMMVNSLHETEACRVALRLAVATIREVFKRA